MKRPFPATIRTTAAILALAALAGAVPAHADVVAPPADAEAGAVLSEKLCAACHVVSASDARAGEPGIPTFSAIANAPDQTAELVAGSIIVPHPPMPAVPLSLPEIRDIVAYIMTLRTEPRAAD